MWNRNGAMRNRTSVLRCLLNFSEPLHELKTALGGFKWESEEDLIALEPAHLIAALERYRAKQAADSEIESWVNMIESREDIGYAPGVKEILWELANPLLSCKLTPERAKTLIHKLSRQTP